MEGNGKEGRKEEGIEGRPEGREGNGKLRTDRYFEKLAPMLMVLQKVHIKCSVHDINAQLFPPLHSGHNESPLATSTVVFGEVAIAVSRLQTSSTPRHLTVKY